MNHIKAFEKFFWNKNKDNDIANKILKKLVKLTPVDITASRGEYIFSIEGFEVRSQAVSGGRSGWGTPREPDYELFVDNVKLDISNKKAKNIFIKIDEIFTKEEEDRKKKLIRKKKENEDYIKKDFRISIRENMSKGECDICGEAIYTDDRICDDCKMNKDEIEFDDTSIHLEQPPQTLPAYPKSQNIYYEAKEEVFNHISYDNFEDWRENRKTEEFNEFEDNYIRSMFNNFPAPYEYELDSDDKSVMNIVIYEQDSTDGVGIRIEKYNDEYFHVLIEDICKDGDEWDSLPFSDGGSDTICDQVQGVVDYIKHALHFFSKDDQKFESIHDKYTKNNYYEFTDKLPSFMSTIHKYENFTEEEIDEISNRYKLPDNIIIRISGGITKVVKSIGKCNTPNCKQSQLTISIKKYRLYIYKYRDEWFRITVRPNYGTMTHQATKHYDYVCDQFIGLLKLLDEFIKTN